MIWPTRLRGFSDEYGSWKTICISRRSGSQPPLPSCVMSAPSKRIEPLVGSSRRTISRAVVDLPQPDSPTRPSVSPSTNVERDVLDRVHHSPDAAEDRLLDRKMLRQVVDLDQRGAPRWRRRRSVREPRSRSRRDSDRPHDAPLPDLLLALRRQVAGIGVTTGIGTNGGTFVSHGSKRYWQRG